MQEPNYSEESGEDVDVSWVHRIRRCFLRWYRWLFPDSESALVRLRERTIREQGKAKILEDMLVAKRELQVARSANRKLRRDIVRASGGRGTTAAESQPTVRPRK